MSDSSVSDGLRDGSEAQANPSLLQDVPVLSAFHVRQNQREEHPRSQLGVTPVGKGMQRC